MMVVSLGQGVSGVGVGGLRRPGGAHSSRDGFELLNAALVGLEPGLELREPTVGLGLAIFERILAGLFLHVALEQKLGAAGSAFLLLLAAFRRSLFTGPQGFFWFGHLSSSIASRVLMDICE